MLISVTALLLGQEQRTHPRGGAELGQQGAQALGGDPFLLGGHLVPSRGKWNDLQAPGV